MGHLLVTTMHKVFAKKIRAGIKWPLILTSMLVIAPIQIASYLASLAVIEGARSKKQVGQAIRAAFIRVLCVRYIYIYKLAVFLTGSDLISLLHS